jgi:hypothetical protein
VIDQRAIRASLSRSASCVLCRSEMSRRQMTKTSLATVARGCRRLGREQRAVAAAA